MDVIGIDQSTTKPGVCLLSPGKDPEFLNNFIPRGIKNVQARIDYISSQLEDLMDYYNTETSTQCVVIFEGISFGGHNFKGKQALYELLGVLKLVCFRFGVDYYEIPPQTLKKYFTGSGRATKEDMIAHASKKLGQSLTDDEADAYALACYGRENYGR